MTLKTIVGVALFALGLFGARKYFERGVDAATTLALNVMSLDTTAPVHTYIMVTLFWPIAYWVDGPGNESAMRYIREVVGPGAQKRADEMAESMRETNRFIDDLSEKHFGDQNGGVA